jgi:hypothetical protein
MPNNNIAPLLPLKNRVLHLPSADLAELNDIVGAFYGNNDVSHSQAILKLYGILLNQLEKYTGAADIARPGRGDNIHQHIYDFIPCALVCTSRTVALIVPHLPLPDLKISNLPF